MRAAVTWLDREADGRSPVFIPGVVATGRAHLRPRFGWPDRRPISLRSVSLLSRNGLRDFLPLPAPPPFLARQESRFRPPFISFRPFGCGSIASGPSTAIEVAVGAARETKE